MGDEDRGHAGALPDLQQLVLKLLAGECVERAERLIHQENIGVVGEHARDRHALFHAARQLVRVAIGKALEPDHPDKFVGGLLDLVACEMTLPRPEADVLPHRHPRKQRVILKHHAAIAAGAGDGLAVDRDLAGGRLFESGDDPQQRGFSAAGGADHADELALGNGKINRRQRLDFVVADRKAFGDAADGQGFRVPITHGVAGSSSGDDC